MKQQIDLDGLKKIELSILKNFHSFCEKNGLCYMLAYGTLLGAVRHKGFIPWDDDIDVMMPRPDYEKFIDLTSDGFSEHLLTLSHRNDKYYAYPFAKVIDTRTVLTESLISSKDQLGVYIDIFPIDGLPEKEDPVYENYCRRAENNWLKTQMASMKLQKGKNLLRTIVKYMTVPIAKLIGPRYFVRKQTAHIMRYPYEKSKRAYISSLCEFDNTAFEKGVYEKRILLPFENEEFYVPAEYDRLLSGLYGNYMEFPPESERVPCHTFDAYYKDE